jgi:two-component system response regulator GlrR
MARILLIDDGEAFLADSFARPPLCDHRWICDNADWSSIVLDSLERRAVDLIVASAGCSRVLGHLARLRDHAATPPIIAVVPENPDHTLLHACFAAADDCVLRPLRAEELVRRIARILGPRDDAAALKERLNSELGLSRLIGTDRKFRHEIEKIPLAARTDGEVLITGETGTGKELCARAIHHLSRRRNFPFVCVDCGALPDQLFENEVFGHARGAFTGADRIQKGLVAIAEGGTLFLDEIDSLSLLAQVKLLRFLQDRIYKPLGAEHFTRADVRIIAATNRNLEQAVAQKAFRSDLFFRINVLRFHMIPLRERRGDIVALAQHFVDLSCAETGSRAKYLSPSARRVLDGRDWPGNVRELYNVIRRAVVFCEGPQILPAHVAPASAQPGEGAAAASSFGAARSEALMTFERRYVEDMLRKHGGNITRAAQEAVKDRRAFGRLVKRHNIDPREFR